MRSQVTAELQQLESKTRSLRDSLNNSLTLTSTMIAENPSLKDKYYAAKLNHVRHTFDLWKDSLLRELITADTMTRSPTAGSPKKNTSLSPKHVSSPTHSPHKHVCSPSALSMSRLSPTKQHSRSSPSKHVSRSSHHHHRSSHHRHHKPSSLRNYDEESLGSKFDYTESEHDSQYSERDAGSVFDYTASEPEPEEEDDAMSKFDYTVSEPEADEEENAGSVFDYTASENEYRDNDELSAGDKFDYTVSDGEEPHHGRKRHSHRSGRSQSKGRKDVATEPHHRGTQKRSAKPVQAANAEDSVSDAFNNDDIPKRSPTKSPKQTWPYPKPKLYKAPLRESPKKEHSSAPQESESAARDVDVEEVQQHVSEEIQQHLSEEILDDDVPVSQHENITPIGSPKPDGKERPTMIDIPDSPNDDEFVNNEEEDEEEDFFQQILNSKKLPDYIPYEFDSEADRQHLGKFRDSLALDDPTRKVHFEKESFEKAQFN